MEPKSSAMEPKSHKCKHPIYTIKISKTILFNMILLYLKTNRKLNNSLKICNISQLNPIFDTLLTLNYSCDWKCEI